jgi:hypothetical protein
MVSAVITSVAITVIIGLINLVLIQSIINYFNLKPTDEQEDGLQNVYLIVHFALWLFIFNWLL